MPAKPPTASPFRHSVPTPDHFKNLHRYAAYAGAAGALQRMGASGFFDGFLRATAHGTPARIIAKYCARMELLGPFEAAPRALFDGAPFDEASAGMCLFAAQVLLEFQRQ